MSFTELLLARAREANEKFALFAGDERVLVGFSGGADSLALLCVLHTILGANVHALHVNHMLRGHDADADEKFCENFCAERNIPFSSVRIDVAALSGGKAVEETARNARYGALTEECKRIGAAKIALAHTASDNTETVLFNLSRGTALAGLRGIPPKRPCGEAEIVRPLILCTREEIEGYCAENGLDFRTDATNGDVVYRRNFIRHEVVPKLRELNPALHTRISAMSEALRRDEDFIKGEAERFLSENRGEGGRVSVGKLCGLHIAVRTRVLAEMFDAASGASLEEKHFGDLEKLLAAGKDGARIVLPGKTAAVTRNGEIFFVSEAKFAEEKRKTEFFERIFPGACVNGGGFAAVLYEKGAKPPKLAEFAENAVFTRKIELPESAVAGLYLRNRQNGDKYVFGGMTRTLKKLLSGETDAAKRVRPVFCDGNGVLWFPGFRLRDDVYRAEDAKKYILFYFEY